MKTPETLQQAIVYFSDPQRAFEYAVKLRWPDGKVVCPRCDGAKHSFIKTRRIWFCYDCNKQFTLKIGTVFEDKMAAEESADDRKNVNLDQGAPEAMAWSSALLFTQPLRLSLATCQAVITHSRTPPAACD